MVRPSNFHSNPDTIADNSYQHADSERVGGKIENDLMRIESAALTEFDSVVSALRGAGTEVVVFDEPHDRGTPDAIFPNNWFSTHAPGTLVLYPMMAPSRRRERRSEIRSVLQARYPQVIDLTHSEQNGEYLEGTGSLVIDHERACALACLSQRTNPQALKRWSERLGIRSLSFEAFDHRGHPIYHTNVMMALGARWALVASETIRERSARDMVLRYLRETGRRVLEISHSEVLHFCANIIELGTSRSGGTIILMSQNARDNLSAPVRDALQEIAPLLAVPIPTVEFYGGGGIRCMVAELW